MVRSLYGPELAAIHEEDRRSAEELADNIRDGLRANGYGIHDLAKCVRPKVEDLGRPMTAQQAGELVGLCATEKVDEPGAYCIARRAHEGAHQWAAMP